VKIVKVKMLKQTVYGGKVLRPDTELHIETLIAKRWCEKSIAVEVVKSPVKEVDEDGSLSSVCDTNKPSGISGDTGSKPSPGQPKAAEESERISITENIRKSRPKQS
jgi:hypothetical protein